MPPRLVLIIDDQPDVRRLLRAGLEALNRDIKIIDIPSGEEALLVLSNQPVDLLVSDVRLPGISGLELIERARQRNPRLKLILMTGLTDPKVRQQVAEAGAEAFFIKPVEMGEFLEVVERCLGELGDPGAPAGPVAETVAPAPAWGGRLSALCNETGAISVILLDESGRILAQAGELPGKIRAASLGTRLAAAMTAAAEVSKSMGNASPRDYLFIGGESCDLLLAHVSLVQALVVVMPPGQRDDQLLATLRLLPLTARDITIPSITPGASNVPGPSEFTAESPVEPQPPEENEIPDEQVIPVLDEIFRQAGQEPLADGTADAFWDTLAEKTGAESLSDPSSLSYEQALQLGLAPSTEEDLG